MNRRTIFTIVLGAIVLHAGVFLLFGQMRALPILLLFGAMFYWLWRVRSRRTLPVLVRHDSIKEKI